MLEQGGPAGPPAAQETALPPPPGISDTAVASPVDTVPAPQKAHVHQHTSQAVTQSPGVSGVGWSLRDQTLGQQWLDTEAADCCAVAKSCPTLYDPMDCSTPGFPVLHYLLEFAQTHVHWVDDVIQPSHLLSDPISSCIHSFPASGSFSVSWLFMSGDQNTGT